MLDIDHFKKFNDIYGHKAGDIVLLSIVQILEKRLSGKVFRYGGEEFIIIYFYKNIKKIYEELDNTRKYISKTKWNIPCPSLTYSFWISPNMHSTTKNSGRRKKSCAPTTYAEKNSDSLRGRVQ